MNVCNCVCSTYCSGGSMNVCNCVCSMYCPGGNIKGIQLCVAQGVV